MDSVEVFRWQQDEFEVYGSPARNGHTGRGGDGNREVRESPRRRAVASFVPSAIRCERAPRSESCQDRAGPFTLPSLTAGHGSCSHREASPGSPETVQLGPFLCEQTEQLSALSCLPAARSAGDSRWPLFTARPMSGAAISRGYELGR